ncbi:IucA/IucC family siderophore biosynthesis protein [Streptomyces sp. C10-9-1]|nr:IucA/IucC family protein [Streptomyces sp. C10-9-1]MCQ6556217.1 IucA/IucC family siderophore biosynthesis protein [Streptomyces sp. C10-9-1]
MLRVLGALLREDVGGLRTRSTLVVLSDGPWLRLPTGEGRALLLPVREDGFQSRWTARLPLLRQEPGGRDLASTGAVLDALARLAAPGDAPGYRAFAEECDQDLLARRLHSATDAAVLARLAEVHGPDPAYWHGHRGSLAHDTLAARTDHPVHPVARGRRGMGADELRSWAPEFHPGFALRWLALPAEHVVHAPGAAGRPGEGWPTPAEAGLPDRLHDSHVLLPVHPMTWSGPLHDALAATGLADRAVPVERPLLDVVPTLSTRTVALASRPAEHLKLPLATSTLGLLNRRTITPASLRDGAAGQRLLARVLARTPRFAGRILLADETRWAHAGHELLAVLRRVQPAGLEQAVVLPLAALPAPAPDGRPVAAALADRFHGGDVTALVDALLTLLFDWQTTLFAHGIALESHQQNVSLVLGGAEGPRLLLKDNDGPRVNTRRLTAALGGGEWNADRLGFADRRVCVTGDGPVTDLFTAITVHLCAGALAFGLGARGAARPDALLALVRDRLRESLDRTAAAYPAADGLPAAAEVLRARLLHAPELPVKAMVTAGTLLTKARSGATDINKHYTTGPNYLLRKA